MALLCGRVLCREEGSVFSFETVRIRNAEASVRKP